ncbi:MAG: hypothetical protein K2X67_03450 [Burkholderiales bacterium]|jgi:hypothetical protein|nr:hypothetical protein [Burkholderiales bacterium]
MAGESTESLLSNSDIIVALIGAGSSLFAAAVGAYFGAKLAFSYSAKARAQEEEDRRSAAANRAIFTLIQQLNLMANIKKQSLDKFRDSPGRHIFMLPTRPIARPDLRLTFDSLDFVLNTPFATTLFEMMLADSWFHNALEAVGDRFQVHKEKFQPVVEAASAPVGNLTEEQFLTGVEMRVGSKLMTELRMTTDTLYTFIDKGIEKHTKISLRFSQEMKSLMPKRKFLHGGIDPAYFKPDTDDEKD